MNSAQAQMYTSQNKKAIKWFEEAGKLYQERNDKKAEELLQKALKEDNKFTEAYIFLAEMSLDKRDAESALSNYKKAIECSPQQFADNYFMAGKISQTLAQYSEADVLLSNFLQFSNTKPHMIDEANRSLKSIKFAINALKNPVPFNPVNMGKGINTAANEYFPAISADGETFLFTREVNDQNAYGGIQEDFYVSKKQNNLWQQANNIGMPINTPMNEGAPSLSADGQTLVFTACQLMEEYGPGRNGFGSCDLFITRKNGSKWSRPINMQQPINSNHWETQPSLSADGKTMYFIRGLKTKQGIQQQDIYVTELMENGKWAAPKKISDKLNTPGREESVFIHPDGKTLYFSSDGHPGMGGLDIFIARLDENGDWSEPENLGYPINTSGDESSLLVGPDGKTAFFSSDRKGGEGKLDLYYFELPEKFRSNAISYMKGKVFDAESFSPLEAQFQLIDLQTSKTIIQSYANAGNGEFLIAIPPGKEYALNVNEKGYLFHSENFKLNVLTNKNEPLIKDIPLQPVKEGEKVILKNVFFATASFDLEEKSKVELDKLVKFMNENLAVSIEISGHTDNIGDKKSNQLLSENRSKSVQKYLIEKGIAISRITAKGYGDNQPIADNSNDEGRAQNRRTEFKITKK
jgi:outer membrane protein OmpA-like peptidoglycan-associated protein/Tol biopolymer transport system component